MNETKVILLGTGTPNAEPDRSGPSVAVVVNDDPYIVDAGPGVVRRANAAGLPLSRITRTFLTHLHSDHTAGYPDLILTPWVLGREEPLEVYGPPGTGQMTDYILAAYQEDINQRLHGLEPANKEGYKTHVHQIEPGEIYEDVNVKVTAFHVKHGSWPAFGYRFQTPDLNIVISGDTAPCDELVKAASGCDILVHEVYSVTGFSTLSLPWQRYHADVHTSSHELARIAYKAKPDLLVVYHQLLWGISEFDLITEIKSKYVGTVRFGRDLDVYP
jgi:ribonuclease BN (tRNA processing enzyme)